MAQLKYDILDRRDTLANWASVNPTLEESQIGYETDTKRVKIGDGITTWNDLDYQFLTVYDKGIPNGVVPLNASGEIDASYINQVAVASTTAFTPAGSLSSTNVQAAIQELDSEKLPLESIRTAGVVVVPTFTNNGDGTVTVGSGQYCLYDNLNYSGVPKTYTIGSTTLAIPDNVDSYILASYNAGTPIVEIVTGVPAVSATDSDRIPIFSLFRSGSDIHHFDWDHLALGLAEKLNKRLRRTDRFHIDFGLGLSESTTRVINIDAGAVWAGANLINLNAVTSGSPETHFYYHVAGQWVRGSISQYNNTQYDNGTDLVTLSNGRYAVNWLYRSVQADGAMYVLLGGDNYTLLQAQGSAEPPKPIEISTQAILVGRIIVLKNANTATQIDKVTAVTFTASTAANHNDLGNIQGGQADERYHLTLAQHTEHVSGASKHNTATKTTTYNILATDYTLRADATAAPFTLTLPDAVVNMGRLYHVKKVDATSNTVTVDTTSSQLIDGSLSVPLLVQYQSLTFQSNGTGWDIL